jgi:hypothetical protein
MAETEGGEEADLHEVAIDARPGFKLMPNVVVLETTEDWMLQAMRSWAVQETHGK